MPDARSDLDGCTLQVDCRSVLHLSSCRSQAASIASPDHDLQAAAWALMGGATTRQYAQQPCEHGMRYRGTGRSCGYCLAMADIAESRRAPVRRTYVGGQRPRDLNPWHWWMTRLGRRRAKRVKQPWMPTPDGSGGFPRKRQW